MIIGLIEDCELDATMFNHATRGHQVFWYDTYDKYLKSSQDHDIVISDYNMPDGNLDILDKVIAKETVPFYIYTGVPLVAFQESIKAHYKAQGVHGIIQKKAGHVEILKEIARYET